jgi:polar amino acid transport system permease protein
MTEIWDLFVKYFPRLMDGAILTIELTIISIILGSFLGLLLGIGKVYGFKPISLICSFFIELIRGTPLLVQLFILYFGLPATGLKLSPWTASVIAFTINSGCYQAEYLRGSLLSIASNQMRAARSLGMTKVQSIIFIMLPQAIRRVIPAWTNEFIYLLKYSSLAYMVGVSELMGTTKVIASRNYRFFDMYIITALIYLVMVLCFSFLFTYLEKKTKIPDLKSIR